MNFETFKDIKADAAPHELWSNALLRLTILQEFR